MAPSYRLRVQTASENRERYAEDNQIAVEEAEIDAASGGEDDDLENGNPRDDTSTEGIR